MSHFISLLRRTRLTFIAALVASGALLGPLMAPTASADTVLRSAELQRSAKATSGTASIVETNDGLRLRFSSDFSTGSGPDVLVLLHRSANPQSYDSADYVNLGLMRRFNGAQEFAIPADVDISQYRSVVLWCRRFNVTFGSGAL